MILRRLPRCFGEETVMETGDAYVGINTDQNDSAQKRIVQGVKIGIAKGKLRLPEDFDIQFDTLDHEIEEMFYGAEE